MSTPNASPRSASTCGCSKPPPNTQSSRKRLRTRWSSRFSSCSLPSRIRISVIFFTTWPYPMTCSYAPVMPMTPTVRPPCVMGRFSPARTVGVASSGRTYSSGKPSSTMRFAPAWKWPTRVPSVLAMIFPRSSIMLMCCPTMPLISSTIRWALCTESSTFVLLSSTPCGTWLPPSVPSRPH